MEKFFIMLVDRSTTRYTICTLIPGGKDLYANTSIHDYAPWQLQQVQDSFNHLSEALGAVSYEICNYNLFLFF